MQGNDTKRERDWKKGVKGCKEKRERVRGREAEKRGNERRDLKKRKRRERRKGKSAQKEGKREGI